jgi:hypothetical protein
MDHIEGECYYYYYFSSYSILLTTHSTVAPCALSFAIVYLIAYSSQSPNIALFSCLLRTLGIVIHFYT